MAASNLPKSRLNQIARRKLGQLGIPSALSRDGDVLEVELISLHGKVRNPLTKEPVPRARFRVVDHDRALFLEPPILAGLAPVPFYEFNEFAELLVALDKALARHVAAMKAIVQRLTKNGVAAEIDAEQGKIVIRVSLPHALGTVVVMGGPESLRPIRLERPGPGLAETLPIEGEPLDGSALESIDMLETALTPIARAAVATRTSTPKRVDDRPAAVRDSGDIVLKLSTDDLPGRRDTTPTPPIVQTMPPISARMPSSARRVPEPTVETEAPPEHGELTPTPTLTRRPVTVAVRTPSTPGRAPPSKRTPSTPDGEAPSTTPKRP